MADDRCGGLSAGHGYDLGAFRVEDAAVSGHGMVLVFGKDFFQD